jgi:hypothetical protein
MKTQVRRIAPAEGLCDFGKEPVCIGMVRAFLDLPNLLRGFWFSSDAMWAEVSA